MIVLLYGPLKMLSRSAETLWGIEQNKINRREKRTCFAFRYILLKFAQHHQLTKLSRRMTKPTKWHVRPAKTQIRPSLIRVFAVRLKNIGPLTTYRARSEDSDQTGRMPMRIWVFAGRTCHFAGFVVRQLKCNIISPLNILMACIT